jgi:hypothetical protein
MSQTKYPVRDPRDSNNTNGRGRTHSPAQSHGFNAREVGLSLPDVAQHPQSEFRPEFPGENLEICIQHESRPGFEHYESFPPHSNNHNSAAFLDFEGASDSSSHDYNYNLSIMSLAYENRTFSDYPQSTIMDDPSHDHSMHQHQRYPSPPAPMSENPYTSAQIDSALEMQMPEMPPKDEDDAGSPGRSKALVKPDREVTKGEDGRYVCSWVGCGEEIRSFNRKCEWSKASLSESLVCGKLLISM